MSYLRKFFLGLGLATALAACATAPSAPDDNVGAAPALFVARDADSTLYLYGTIHLRKTGESWGGPHVEAALAESEEVWTETDLSPEAEARVQTLVLQRGLSTERALSSWLTPEEKERMGALLTRLGMPPEALEPMRPWLAGLTLNVLPMLREGYDPQAGVDKGVVAWARANGRTMRWFETPEQQIEFFAGLSDEVQHALLVEAITEAERAPAMIAMMTSGWERGDVEALETLVVEEMQREYADLYQLLIVERNNAWMTVLTQELQGSGVDFVAVGAGHVIGPDGLVAQLRARGYTVTRVQAPAT